MFELHDVVILKRTTSEVPVPAGTVGTIVDMLEAVSPVYLVEFPEAKRKPPCPKE